MSNSVTLKVKSIFCSSEWEHFQGKELWDFFSLIASLFNRGQSLKERINLSKRKFFPLRLDTILEMQRRPWK